MYQTLPIRYDVQEEVYELIKDSSSFNIKVASPGIIQSFNPVTQTAVVQLSIMEKMCINSVVSWKSIPPLVDVPVMYPRGGGFSITFPVVKGTECLVIFSDSCIDAFWQSGGINNVQLDKRRHDLSDGLAIITGISQPNKLNNVSTTSTQIRSDDGATIIDIAHNALTFTAPSINLNSSNVTISGKQFISHEHSGVQGGSSNTGGVV